MLLDTIQNTESDHNSTSHEGIPEPTSKIDIADQYQDRNEETQFDFAKSSLFAPPSKDSTGIISDRQNSNTLEFQISDSILFADSQAVSQKQNPNTDLDHESNVNHEVNGHLDSHTDFPYTSPDVSRSSQANTKPKDVKLFSGNTIKLKPKHRTIKCIDIEHLTLDETDNLFDMDRLFNRVDLKEQAKSNRAKIESVTEKKTKPKSTKIWSDKYKPTSFMQLCSAGNDKQYRLILHWLKNWSHVVFGEEKANKLDTDPLGRPHKKILLVHGPLGVGKTAAVHLLASQMGYAIQELNAANSMDTLPQAANAGGNSFSNASAALRLKIMNALTTNSISANGAPSCLIIDEVDTSMNSSDIVKVLNDLCYSDQRATYKSYNQGDKGQEGSNYVEKRKKDKKHYMLNRPIICIANDIYLNTSRAFGKPPMEKLRPLCEIIQFKKAQSTKGSGVKSSGNALRSVKDHLMKINHLEKLGLDYQQIGEIVEVCEGDIRACLNYLQFSGQRLDPILHPDKAGINGSNKDSQLSWFAMVDLLFKRNGQLSKDENFDDLLELVMNGSGKSASSSSGSLDKVVRGCFSRYLDVVHFQDDSLVKPSELSDWLYFYDTVQADNDVNNYSSLVSLKVWSLFSEINPQRIREGGLIPDSRSIEFDSFEKTKQNHANIKRLTDNLPLNAKIGLGCGSSNSSDAFSCQVLPYIDSMLTPDSGGTRIKNNFEKFIISKTASLLHEFNIKLESHRDLETNFTSLQMYPSWDEIVNFDNHLTRTPFVVKTKQVQSKRQRLFPLVQAEIERIIMGKKANKRPLTELNLNTEKVKDDIEPKKKKQKFGSSIEFFKDRYDGLSTQINSSGTKDPNHEATRIWVKYHEGFSNAVRKNIGWSDLWMS